MLCLLCKCIDTFAQRILCISTSLIMFERKQRLSEWKISPLHTSGPLPVSFSSFQHSLWKNKWGKRRTGLEFKGKRDSLQLQFAKWYQGQRGFEDLHHWLKVCKFDSPPDTHHSGTPPCGGEDNGNQIHWQHKRVIEYPAIIYCMCIWVQFNWVSSTLAIVKSHQEFPHEQIQ